jgi:hypothetical protein
MTGCKERLAQRLASAFNYEPFEFFQKIQLKENLASAAELDH